MPCHHMLCYAIKTKITSLTYKQNYYTCFASWVELLFHSFFHSSIHSFNYTYIVRFVLLLFLLYCGICLFLSFGSFRLLLCCGCFQQQNIVNYYLYICVQWSLLIGTKKYSHHFVLKLKKVNEYFDFRKYFQDVWVCSCFIACIWTHYVIQCITVLMICIREKKHIYTWICWIGVFDGNICVSCTNQLYNGIHQYCINIHASSKIQPNIIKKCECIVKIIIILRKTVFFASKKFFNNFCNYCCCLILSLGLIQ